MEHHANIPPETATGPLAHQEEQKGEQARDES